MSFPGKRTKVVLIIAVIGSIAQVPRPMSQVLSMTQPTKLATKFSPARIRPPLLEPAENGDAQNEHCQCNSFLFDILLVEEEGANGKGDDDICASQHGDD